MVAFVLGYTVYFSAGISHRATVRQDGSLELESWRRTVRVAATGVTAVEGPTLPVGFVRFRLEREKVYLLCRPGDAALRAVVAALAAANPELERKRL